MDKGVTEYLHCLQCRQNTKNKINIKNTENKKRYVIFRKVFAIIGLSLNTKQANLHVKAKNLKFIVRRISIVLC